ncbi:hypothetical protein BX600DRAFT_544955 [Xylariales sp. PMI_506]|nr:hypothetical protein BX600DRAFT_544955 [Xylariales sp. PMI_506]
MPHDPLSDLVISVRKSAEFTLTVSVTNQGDGPLTILAWESPLDPAALQLGVVKLQVAGSPLDIPTIHIRRKVPPSPESLVTIEPGQAAEQQIRLGEPLVSPDRLTGEVKVLLEGRWVAVWQVRREDLEPRMLENIGVGEEGGLTGPFSMEPHVLEF